MSVTLTYDVTLNRIIIDCNGLGAAVTALVERSTNLITWTTVRGGLDVSITSGAFDLPISDYEFTPDVENFYRVVSIAEGGMLLDGTGDRATTPDNAALDITGDIDLRARALMTNWSADGAFVAKYNITGNQRSYSLVNTTAGKLGLRWSVDGTAFIAADSTVVHGFANGSIHWIRATLDVNGPGTGLYEVKFYTSADGNIWTQLGATVIGGAATSIFSSSAIVEVGSRNNGTTEQLTGRIDKVEIRNGIDSTIVANPDFSAQKEGTTSFTDSTAKVWSLVGDAAIVNTYDSIIPILTATWLKSIARPFLNMSFSESEIISAIDRPERDGVFDIIGRSLPIAVTDIRSSRQYNVRLVTHTKADANNLDMLLASGDTLFLHVPSSWPLPSAYVAVSNTPRELRIPTEFANWTLAVKEVAAPSADVIGSTSTYQTMLSTYATYTALAAAHSDYADVLTLIGSPDEVIVP